MGNAGSGSEGAPSNEAPGDLGDVGDAAASSVVQDAASVPDFPQPVLQEPAEARKEPHDWLVPRSGLLPMGGGAAARGLRRVRLICRTLGFLLLLSGFFFIAGGYIHKYWAEIMAWGMAHSIPVIGTGLMVFGVLVQCLASCCGGFNSGSEAPAWDDSMATDVMARRPSRFSLRLWNDSARFGHDVEALDLLLGKTEGRAASQEVLADPELRTLVKKAARVEIDHQIQREDTARKSLVDRCRQDLEGGISIRRLRQKLEPRCFVLDFSDGDFTTAESLDAAVPLKGIQAQIQQLRDAVSFLLTVCTPYDEVVVRVTSPGGVVGDYGLASAQLARIRHAGVRLVACVDIIAASGGYMLACVADKVVAAPFAAVGSIGVIAGMPNFHRILQRYEVDYLELTAGKFKRPVSLLTKNDAEGIAKFQEELDTVHTAFTAHVAEGRGNRIEGGADSAATGEIFLANQALDRGLVDELITSDEYLRRRAAEGAIIIEVRGAPVNKSWFQDCCCGACSAMGQAGAHSADALGAAARSMLHAALRAGSSIGVGSRHDVSSGLASHLLASSSSFAEASVSACPNAVRSDWAVRSAVGIGISS